jgi:prevent-host-death family protein
MSQVNLHDAKTHLSRLVEAAARGEEIIIAMAGKPMARLVPLRSSAGKERRPGALKGKIWVAADFDAPLTAEEQSAWTEAAIPPSKEPK